MFGQTYANAPFGGVADTSGSITTLSSVLAARALTCLLEIKVQSGAGVGDANGGFGALAFGAAPFGSAVGEPGTAGQSTLRFSDTGFVTQPSDVPPDLYYDGRATIPLVVDRRISLSPESPIDGAMTGSAELRNDDAALDSIVAGNAVDGQEIRLLVGATSAPYAKFVERFVGIGAGWNSDGKRVRVEARDSTYLLDGPVQPNVYGGAGLLDGNSDLAGTPKPLAFGGVANVSPILIDPASLIFQVHDGSIQGVTSVYDRGVALTSGGDTANLYVGTTQAGRFRTDNTKGLIQLGSTPAGQVTADVQGDNGSGYRADIPEITLRILRERAALATRFMDESSFASLTTVVSGAGGVYITKRETAREILTRLLSGIGAYWFTRRDGRVRAQRLAEPATLGGVLRLDSSDLLGLRLIGLPKSVFPPNYRRTIGYQKNYTVQGSDLAAAVTDQRRQFLGTEWRTSVATNTSVRLKHVRASDPALVESNLNNKMDADTLASSLLALHGAERMMIEIRIKTLGLEIEMGDTILIKWPKFGLQNGRLFRAFPIRDDYARREVTIVGWG